MSRIEQIEGNRVGPLVAARNWSARAGDLILSLGRIKAVSVKAPFGGPFARLQAPRGLRAAILAVGDGALGFCAAPSLRALLD